MAAAHAQAQAGAGASDADREAVLAEPCSERFVDCSPAQVWATLLDEGRLLPRHRRAAELVEERRQNPMPERANKRGETVPNVHPLRSADGQSRNDGAINNT